MGQIKVVLIFNEDDERQREAGEYLKDQEKVQDSTCDRTGSCLDEKRRDSSEIRFLLPEV